MDTQLHHGPTRGHGEKKQTNTVLKEEVQGDSKKENTFMLAGCEVLTLGKREHYLGTRVDTDTWRPKGWRRQEQIFSPKSLFPQQRSGSKKRDGQRAQAFRDNQNAFSPASGTDQKPDSEDDSKPRSSKEWAYYSPQGSQRSPRAQCCYAQVTISLVIHLDKIDSVSVCKIQPKTLSCVTRRAISIFLVLLRIRECLHK